MSSDEDANDDSSGLSHQHKTSALLTAADRLLEVAEHGTISNNKGLLLDPGGSGMLLDNTGPKFRSIEERLLQLHIEESAKAASPSNNFLTNGGNGNLLNNQQPFSPQQPQHHLNPCSNLVSLLCRKDRCNRLMVTLLPNNEGYSVHVVLNNANNMVNSVANGVNTEVELFRLPYEDDDFLTYVDNEELPASIIDLLEKAWPELFYSGCVIAEVRDHRRLLMANDLHDAPGASASSGSTQGPTTSHVLLRPTTQSLICDVNLLCEKSGWTSKEDRAALESQLCLATQGPLCLDPDPMVSIMARKSCVRRQKFATPAMRRHAKMFSQTGINRKRKLEETTAPPELKLHDFIQKQRSTQAPARPNPQDMLQQHQAMMRANLRAIVVQSNSAAASPMPTGSTAASMMMSPPDHNMLITDVSKHARAIQRRADVTDMTPHVVEEYILETAERGVNRIYHTKLTIFQRLANEEYLGELYVERDFNERDKKGSTCRFVLGTRPHALRYINQFTEIFTEEGRKPVKITHLVPNQKPRITFTPGMRERMNERAAAVAAANAAHRAVNSGTTPGAAGSTVVNNNTPIKQPQLLSVSVAPGGPSILKQTLSAPSNSPQLPIHTVQQAVRTVSLPPTPTQPQLPQTPHPPQQILQQQQVSIEATNTNTDDSGEQEMAISAIMQSLMKDSAQFEADNKQQLIPPPTGSLLSGGPPTPQLPTCPVPQASLATMANSTSPVKLPNTPQSPSSSTLLAKRVSLKNLLSAQAANQSNDQSPIKSPVAANQVKVTMSQLAAQLSRPVTLSAGSNPALPSYTQALADQQAHAKVVQASPRPRLIVTAQQPNSMVRTLSNDKEPPPGSTLGGSSGLQALLSSAPNENVIPVDLGNSNGSSNAPQGGSLLERLVSGQPIAPINSNMSPNNPTSSVGSSVGGLSPSPVTSRTLSSNSADSSNEITLAALLSKPPVQTMSPLAVAASPSSTSQMGSPTKASPLIQQLQQPIPPPRTPMGAAGGLPQSPRQQPQASPRMTSPRSVVPSSPQSTATVVRSNSLQQQLMQPPKSQSLVSVPLPVQEMSNLHNGVAGGNVNAANNAAVVATSSAATHNGAVSLQNLLQGGMAVQVSQHPGTQTTNSIPVQLNIPGLSAPVTLSLNVQDQQQQGPHQGGQQAQQPQPQQQPGQQPPQSVAQKMVPTSTVVTVASSAGGTVLIPQGSNIIQLPQQPVISQASIATMRTPTGQTVQLHAANANNILKGAQVVQVRGQHGGQPLYVQMPVTSATSVGQSIQIVRSVDQPVTVRQQPQVFQGATMQPQQGPQPQPGGQGQPGGQQQLILNSVKGGPAGVAGQPSLITLSQQQHGGQQLAPQPQQVVLQANNATVLQPQQPSGQLGAPVGGPGGAPRQVAIQLQEQPNAGMMTQKVVNNAATAAAAAAVANQRMRQHRKQSLK